MAHWFSQASQAFRPLAPAEAVEFQLRCACGRTIDGVRTKRHQVIVCSSCAQQLFVLPTSVYPTPKTKKKTPKGTKKKAKGKAGAKPSAPKRTRPGLISSFGAAWRRQIDSFAQAMRQTRRRVWTPLNKVLLGIGLIVSLTAYAVLHMRALEQARRVLAQAPQAGMEALEKQDFATAALEFGKACRALDVLGRKGSDAQLLRQRFRESTAAGLLTPQSVFELVQEAIQSESAAGGDWRDTFRTVHRGGWLVIDTSAALRLEAQGGHLHRIELPISVQGNDVTMIADFSPFDALWESSPPDRVIFAAQLEDFRRFSEHEDVPGWEIVLAPKTAFLWADAEVLGEIGFPLDDDTKETLSRQARLLGVEP